MKLTNVKFTVFYCLLAGFATIQANDSKSPDAPIRDACSHWNKRPKDCVYKGISIPQGKTKTVAPCMYGTCENGKVNIAIADCAPPPKGCRYESTLKECCKLVCDKGCKYNGIFIPEGETRTVAPCQFASCSCGKVAIAVADCPPPQNGCRYESTMEVCCKKVCDKGCTYNDIFIPEGETKTVAPCQYGRCDGGKVIIAIADCGPLETGCRYESSMEECCKLVCNKGCTYNGIHIAEGETKTVAPCEYATCFNGEVAVAVADCARPQDGCYIQSTLEECCKQVCDKGCIYNDIFIPEGENRKVGPCEFGSCNSGKVDIAVQDCARPPSGCRYESTWDQCCNLVCDNMIDMLVEDLAPAKSA